MGWLNGDGGTPDTQSEDSSFIGDSVIDAARLHEVTSQMAERELKLREDATAKDAMLRQSENRVASVEMRIRERDAQVTALKEERAASARQIENLKNQLYQLQFQVEETTSDKVDQDDKYRAELASARRETSDARRALDALDKSRADALVRAAELERENDELRGRLDRAAAAAREGDDSGGDRPDRSLEAVEVMRRRLSELERENATLSSNAATNAKLNAREVSNLRNMLRARDDAIQSLQGRVERGERDMTELERELDVLRGERTEDGPVEGGVEAKRREDRIDDLTRETEELKGLVEKQNQALKDMTAKWDRQKEEHHEQCKLAEQRGEEIEQLKFALLAEGSKREGLSESYDAGPTRVTELEVELRNANEKVEELTSALNEAAEEIDELHAEVVFKGGRIASLEREIQCASSLLEARTAEEPPPQASPEGGGGREEAGSFGRLREEIRRVTAERARLESDHARQLSLLATAKDGDIARLEREMGEVRVRLMAETENVTALKASLKELESSNANLSVELAKTREVMDQLDAEEDLELEVTKQKVTELQLANVELHSEIKGLRSTLAEKEQELLEKEESSQGELLKAQEALIALERERNSPGDDSHVEKIASLNEKLSACEERVREAEAKLGRTVREKETVISDLRIELMSKERYSEDLRRDLELLQLSVESGPSKRNYGMAIDPEWHEPDTISKLKVQVLTLKKDKTIIEKELRAKIEARDATIATLVLSSSNQDASIAELKSEICQLQTLLDRRSSLGTDASQQLKELEASRRREVELLKERTHDLTIELKQTKRKLLSASGQLESAMTQLKFANTMPDVQDLAGRLVISEQAQKMLKTENVDKLKERDAAIANLLQSVQANEGVISNLRSDIDSFKKKLNETVEENKRLQHESEIFATQIIDQDKEFEALNARLKEKTSEITALKREIASSSADVRNMKHLQSQLDELREEKWKYSTRINKLEVELRDVELKKAEQSGFEFDRLKLELKSAIADKAETEDKMSKQIDSLRQLHSHAVEEVRKRDGKIALLEKELTELRGKISDDSLDDVFLDDQTGQSKVQLIEERDMLLIKIDNLSEEIESLRGVSESMMLSELKSKLARSEQVREELEKDRLHFMSNKDKEMDRLHLQLAETRQQSEARELEQLNLLKKLETENQQLQEKFAIQIMEKNSKIVALEQTLAAQEQVVGTMSNEMDQLQNGMEKISIQRRAEIEELNQELMDYTSKATRLEREVLALTMKLDDKKLKHKAEVQKLKDRIAAIESGDVQYDKHDVELRESELQEKNEHLKWLNASLKEENKKIKEKLESLKNSSTKTEESPISKTAKNNDKWRNVALQEQVAVLSQRVIELEEAASTATHSRSSHSPRQSILHSPVIRSSLERDSPAGTPTSSSVPKSALRHSTYTDAKHSNANDLLSDAAIFNSTAGQPPAMPRPDVFTPPQQDISTPLQMGRSKGSKISRFSIRRKGSLPPPSPKFDDASNGNSTTNYDF
ncbi:hypothetical protein ACHAW5_009384 [Stephanodiscus triporus]|uniref:Uncharacterized protein n=1 Tax=Stephanodiscus triporus TaxID=2934178 RepID=A0ABD3PLJ2_9STRA